MNSSLSCICVKETMVLVTLVPMLAPMIMGMAVLTGTSAATRPTMMEVEVEEDWEGHGEVNYVENGINLHKHCDQHPNHDTHYGVVEQVGVLEES